MARVRKPSPQTLAVLDALAKAGAQWSHGYELSRRLELTAGTLYPILIRLTERGLLETTWESDPPRGRPPRHLYRLSPDGAEYVRGLEAAAGQRSPEAVRRDLSRPSGVQAAWS
jgi:DNA-binding PadR family transcriptional regulator